MMSLVPKLLTRPRGGLLTMRMLRALKSTNANIKTPPPVMAGYPEFLDDMLAKAERMEASVEKLGSATKTNYGTTIKWMDPKDIDALMDLAAVHKKEMQQQLQQMKDSLEAAKTNYAVDAPDGESDGHLEEEMEEITHILNNDIINEDSQDYAVGIKWMDPSDIHALMNLKETHKKEMKELLQQIQDSVQAAKSNYAVDAPDGETDGHLEEEMEEVNHIIDEASHANKQSKPAAIKKQESQQRARASDPEHW